MTTRMLAALTDVLMLLGAAYLPGLSVAARAAERDAAALPEAFLSYLAENVRKGAEAVDVEAFGIEFSDAVRDDVSDYIFNRRPDLFNVTGAIRFSFYSSGRLAEVYFQYACSPAEYAARLKKAEAAADKLLSGIAGNPALSDVQKALLIHDRLAVHCEYDTAVYEGRPAGENARNIYGALVERRAVCDGYTRAYIYLLGKVGIRSVMNRSDALYHSWNIVYIGGKPYHVDVTFDDPTSDVTGRVYHNNFLVSSAALYKEEHAASDYDVTPQDTKYDNAFWRDSVSSFVLAGGNIYYIDNVSKALKTYDKKTLLTLSDDWGGWYESDRQIRCYARLSTDGTYLFYTDKAAVYKYDIASGKSEKVFVPTASGGKMIFGMVWEDGKLICDFTASPNDYFTSAKSAFRVTKALPAHVHSWDKGKVATPAAVGKDGTMVYTCAVCKATRTEKIPALKDDAPAAYGPCDADGDGKVTSADARLALRASVLLEKIQPGTPAFKAADADHDNALTPADARLILRASVGLEKL